MKDKIHSFFLQEKQIQTKKIHSFLQNCVTSQRFQVFGIIHIRVKCFEIGRTPVYLTAKQAEIQFEAFVDIFTQILHTKPYFIRNNAAISGNKCPKTMTKHTSTCGQSTLFLGKVTQNVELLSSPVDERQFRNRQNLNVIKLSVYHLVYRLSFVNIYYLEFINWVYWEIRGLH